MNDADNDALPCEPSAKAETVQASSKEPAASVMWAVPVLAMPTMLPMQAVMTDAVAAVPVVVMMMAMMMMMMPAPCRAESPVH